MQALGTMPVQSDRRDARGIAQLIRLGLVPAASLQVDGGAKGAQIVALTYASAIDDPGRFTSSGRVGAHFGLTPNK
jgi:hypothetical protein